MSLPLDLGMLMLIAGAVTFERATMISHIYFGLVVAMLSGFLMGTGVSTLMFFW